MPKLKKKSEILQASLRYLWDGGNPDTRKERFICHALGRVKNADPASVQVIVDIIGRRLFPAVTLTHWLDRKGIDINFSDPKPILDHRKAWVLLMIKEFKAKGA